VARLSKSNQRAVTATFKDSTPLLMGIEIILSEISSIFLLTPLDSFPKMKMLLEK